MIRSVSEFNTKKNMLFLQEIESIDDHRVDANKDYELADKNLSRKRPSFKTSPADLNVFLSDLVQ